MGIDITNAKHVSIAIDQAAAAGKSLQQIIEDLNNFTSFWLVNGIQPAITAGGAVFPPEFNVTPAQLSAARNAINGALVAINGSLTAAELTNIDRVVRNIGVLTGSG